MMKSLLLLTLFVSFNARAQLHRFYRGYTLPTVTPEAFLETINATFFPLFPQAVGEGLVAYRPALFNEDKALNIPQEIVLLTFRDAPTYDAYLRSAIGQRIRAAHGPLFDVTKSKSLVPQAYSGKASYESAYLLNLSRTDYTSGVSGVLVQAEPFGAPEVTLKEVERILTESQQADAIVLIAEGLVIEYLFAQDEKALEELRKKRCSLYKGAFKTNKFVALNRHKIGERRVAFGQGVDAQW